MADQILDKARDLVEGQIDFEGQRFAELLCTALLATFGVISFSVGYVTSNVWYSLYVGLAGTALTFLIVVPPWPFFNQNPVQWLPSNSMGGMAIEVDGKKVT